MGIKNYKEFNTLHIFDFDDTLVNSPRFEDTILKYLKENISSKDLLDKSLDYINREIEDLELENGRLYIPDPEGKIKIRGNWVRKKSRVYLMSPYLFSEIEESLPKNVRELSKLYNSVDNKCILTARSEKVRDKILKTMKSLGLEYPKYGVYMRPEGRKNAGKWKGEKIVEIVKKYNFENVIFYDDNPKYIKNSKKVVNSELPNLNFKTIKINKE